MWAQSMVEYGLLSSVAAGVTFVQTRVSAWLADGTSRTVLIGAGVLLAFWLVRRR